MGRHKLSGFTVIEVVLFLGITGLLAMMTFIGTGSSINVQRYRDSVTSLKSFLQQQYSDVVNIENSHTASDIACASITAANRGQSDCVILGRYVANVGADKLVVKTVVGKDNSELVTNDIDSLQKYAADFSSVLATNQDYPLTWGTTLNKTNGPNYTTNFSMLIIRSPLSGSILTFISQDKATSPPSNWLNPLELVILPDSQTKSLKLCINSNNLFSGKKMMIQVLPNSANGNGVRLLGDGDSGNECN